MVDLRKTVGVLLLFLGAARIGTAQNASGPYAYTNAEQAPVSQLHVAALPSAAPLVRIAPELALDLFEKRSAEQSTRLAASTDHTVVKAELPDTSQKGEYELVRSFTAQPRALSFASVKFTGDGFVKSNVIIRLLQSEVEHVEKGDSAETALTEKNYKFSYKGSDEIDGHPVHVFQLKPRRKAPGLFKGKIYLDAYTGSIRRAEGTLVKSPSFFVKNLEFVQDYDDIEGFTVPTHLHSSAKARIIGRAIVNIIHKSYELKSVVQQAILPSSAAGTQ